MTALCDAHVDAYPRAHTCGDPVACAIGSLLEGVDPTRAEVDRLHELLDRVEEACGASKAKVAEMVLRMIHTERGGPR